MLTECLAVSARLRGLRQSRRAQPAHLPYSVQGRVYRQALPLPLLRFPASSNRFCYLALSRTNRHLPLHVPANTQLDEIHDVLSFCHGGSEYQCKARRVLPIHFAGYIRKCHVRCSIEVSCHRVKQAVLPASYQLLPLGALDTNNAKPSEASQGTHEHGQRRWRLEPLCGNKCRSRHNSPEGIRSQRPGCRCRFDHVTTGWRIDISNLRSPDRD